MKKLRLSAALLVMATPVVFYPSAALAAGDAELQAEVHKFRDELQQLRDVYEARIQALEQRLAKAEQESVIATVAPPNSTAPSGEGAFNPAISLVLNGVYTRQTQEPAGYRIRGFFPSGNEIEPPRRGFSLGEAELSMAANIDPTLRGVFTASLAADGGGADIEEAFIQTLGFGNGLTFKAGRFLSSIGYLNDQHSHVWSFSDAPLVYKALLGNQLRNDGIQVKWLAPTDRYLELGFEASAGGAFPATDNHNNGAALTTVFAHVGDDVGDSHRWRAGLSWMGASPRNRTYDDSNSLGLPVSNSFSGSSRTLGADLIWKWAPHGDVHDKNFTFQTEYLRRHESGQLDYDLGGAAQAVLPYAAQQSGWYAQGVYQFMPHWRAGYRHDRLDAGTYPLGLSGGLTAADFPALQSARPRRDTLMLDYAASEFSLVRLQFARDRARSETGDNQIWLQYVVNLGAHGAHKF